jgi:hypothetical protein
MAGEEVLENQDFLLSVSRFPGPRVQLSITRMGSYSRGARLGFADDDLLCMAVSDRVRRPA